MTHSVKVRLRVETHRAVHYNDGVLKPRFLGHLLYVGLALTTTTLLMGGACEKKTAKAEDTGAIAALDRSGSADAPVDKTPLPGIDTSKLSSDQQAVFYKLLGSLSSPCGKAHSLRTSFTSDTSCKRAPFAVRYVLAMLADDATEDEVRKYYEAKYKNPEPPVKIDVSKAPHYGSEDAPVKIVEFYDYGCPHCKLFKPMLDQVLSDENGKVVAYFKEFPLEGVPGHENSKSAAQAALAANAQGKFKEMHDLLFDNAPNHDHEHVSEYAKQIGLDMTKFEADYAAFADQVEADRKEGEGLDFTNDEGAKGVDETPTVFINGRVYSGPRQVPYIEMWIDEELAVNR